MAFGKITAFVFVICALSALAPWPAFAAPPAVTVRLNDVDANTDEGAQVLLRRIERASREVCGKDVALRYPSTRRAYQLCTLQTMHNVIADIGNARLHAAFVDRIGYL